MTGSKKLLDMGSGLKMNLTRHKIQAITLDRAGLPNGYSSVMFRPFHSNDRLIFFEIAEATIQIDTNCCAGSRIILSNTFCLLASDMNTCMAIIATRYARNDHNPKMQSNMTGANVVYNKYNNVKDILLPKKANIFFENPLTASLRDLYIRH